MDSTRGLDFGSDIFPQGVKKRASQLDNSISRQAKRTKRTSMDLAKEPTVRAPLSQSGGSKLQPKSGSGNHTITPTTARKHIRFGSNSPPPAPVLGIINAPVRAVEEENMAEDSDDDAAPESLSLSIAQAQALATQAGALKTIHEQQATARQRRRKRDRQLKEQVELSGKRKGRDEKERDAAVDKNDISEAELEQVGGKSYSLDSVPALLPDELLATEAPIRPPTPPPTKTPQQQHKQAARSSSITAPLRVPRQKPPRDLTIGGQKIRVMASRNSLLPPKINTQSKSIRQAWLQGRLEFAKTGPKCRKGIKGESKLQRRTVGGFSKGFV